MADNLGLAVLDVTVNTNALKKGLETAKKLVEGFDPKFAKFEKSIQNLAKNVENTTTRVQTLNTTLNTAPGGAYNKISAQIFRLSAAARTLNIQSKEYVQTLQRIRELSFVRDARANRQRVNADFEAFRSGTLTSGFGAPNRLPGLPNTIAADLQLISELTQRLRNVDRSSGEYGATLRELDKVQRRVGDAINGTSESYRRLEAQENGAIRRAEKLRRVQEYYADKNPRAGGVRDQSTGALIASGSNAKADEQRFRIATERQQEISDIFEADLQRARETRIRKQNEARLRAQELLRSNQLTNRRQAAGRQRLQGAVSSALIGGGFPLLFGQGGGASLGGLLGGGLGGAAGGGFGFGVSIVGTIIGSAVDELINRTGELAKALRDPVKSFDLLIEKSVLASEAQERYVQALINVGREAEAAAALREEAGKTIDPGAAALLASAQDRYNRSISDAQDLLGNFVAGPAAEFLNFISDLVRGAGFVPRDQAAALTGRESVQRARLNQRLGEAAVGTGASIAALGLALTPTPLAPLGAGLVLTGGITAALGAGQINSAKKRERVANSQDVRNAEDAVTAVTARRLETERAINNAKAQGLTVQAESLGISKQLQQVEERRRQAILQAEVGFAGSAQRPDDLQSLFQQRISIFKTAGIEAQSIVAAQQAEAAAAAKQLGISQRLVGLSGRRLEIEQSRIAIETSASNRDISIGQLRDAQVAASRGIANQKELDALKAAAAAAESRYAATRLQELDKIRQAEADLITQRFEAANRLSQARGVVAGLEATPGQGLNQFLTPEQQQLRLNSAIGNRGADLERAISLASNILGNQGIRVGGNTVGGINDAFLRELRGIVSGAAGGRGTIGTINGRPIFGATGPAGSLEGFKRVDDFINAVFQEAQARTDLNTATQNLATANEALSSVNTQLAEQVLALTQKDWQVIVNVPGGSASGDVVGAVTGLL